MMFQYRGKNREGQDVEGFIEGSNKNDAIATLSDQGVAILFLEAQSKKSALNIHLPFLNRIKTKDLVLFSRQLAVMTTATLPIVQALRILVDQTDNVQFKSVISEIADDVEGGERLSNALERHNKIFGNFFVAMVRSGETSGSIDKVLNYLADEQEKDYALVSKIKGAMIYPAFILAALGGVGLIMMVYVVPKITAILVETGGELPVATKILIGTSAFLVHWWWAIIIFLIAIFIGLKYLLRQPEPRKIWDHLKLKLPVFGSLFQRIYIVRFTRSMGTLVEGGVPITTSLNIVSDIVGNAFYKDIIDRTARDVQDGNPIASLFLRTKEIPPMIAHMLSVGEKTGRIGDVLNKMTDFYAREIEGLVANLVSLIEPLIMVIMGVGVGIMVAAVITPMYNMSSGF
ncbi:MAG TPA: type II secretion system F family protein [Patescibacteria group bacterium]|nr:type II secretion system F family protein [Patescibacteria group bacterium]